MAPGSPNAHAAHSLIFGSGGPTIERVAHRAAPDADDLEPELEDFLEHGSDGKPRSMYVTLFEDMVTAVMEQEQHLFHDDERAFLKDVYNLNYAPKYLLIRLCLRKPGKWFRLSALKYQAELGGTLETALRELCAGSYQQVKQEEPEIIDLTFDEDENAPTSPPPLPPQPPQPKADLPSQPEAGPSSVKIEDLEAAEQPCGNLTFYVEDHNRADLRELLDCLNGDELKSLAREMKIKAVGARHMIIEALLRTSSSQRILPFRPLKVKNMSGKKLLQTTLTFAHKIQAHRLREMIIKILGGCVRVNEAVVLLLRRLNLVYLRATQYTTDLLTPSILSYARRRSYATYTSSRTPNIWPSRAALLAYERALVLEAQVDNLVEGTSSTRGRSRSVSGRSSAQRGFSRSISPVKKKENGAAGGEPEPEPDEEVPARIQDAKALKTLLGRVQPEWEALVEAKGEEDARERGLERFDSGHVLTRIVYKCADALGILKEHNSELAVLEKLLGQRRWRRGRRGAWYDRRALILTQHLAKLDLSDEIHRIALTGLIEAFNDPDTRLVYRPKLERRLTRLEKKLNIPLDERHTCEGKIEASKKVYISGVRVRNAAAALHLDSTGRKLGPSPGNANISEYLKKPETEEPKLPPVLIVLEPEQKGKSTWKGNNGIVVNVETLALQHYERQGYKGYHCESSIVTTLFGLLFWDVIFAPVPGAFETPYQSAPLDLGEDSFYFARQELFEHRLSELEAGMARQILEAVDSQHRERGTWCVGVRWDRFPQQDLLQIVECFPRGKSLAAICRLLSEDYVHNCSGVPDLFLWNPKTKHCKFVEVKGPGDRLQENQKIWIEVLERAQVNVEVCHVEEEGKEKEQKSRGHKPKGNSRKTKQSASDTEMEMEGPESEEEYIPGPGHSDLENNTTQLAEPSSGSRKRLADDIGEPLIHPAPKRLRSTVSAPR